MIIDFDGTWVETLDEFLLQFPKSRQFYITEMKNANYKYDEDFLSESIREYYFDIGIYENNGIKICVVDSGDIMNIYLNSISDKFFTLADINDGYLIQEIDLNSVIYKKN